MSKPIFEHRHFTWLAHWARDNLSSEQIGALCYDLEKTNPRFDHERFLNAANGKPHGRDAARCNIVP